VPYDPEGALGTLNSIVICFLGVQAGRILTHYHNHHIGIIVRLSIWGVALVRLYTQHCTVTLCYSVLGILVRLLSIWGVALVRLHTALYCVTLCYTVLGIIV